MGARLLADVLCQHLADRQGVFDRLLAPRACCDASEEMLDVEVAGAIATTQMSREGLGQLAGYCFSVDVAQALTENLQRSDNRLLDHVPAATGSLTYLFNEIVVTHAQETHARDVPIPVL